MVDWNTMRECMCDAGCSEATIQRAEHFYQNGSAAIPFDKLQRFFTEYLR